MLAAPASKHVREDSHVGGVSEVKVSEFSGTEPAKPVMLAGTLVHDFAVPVIHHPDRQFNAWSPADSFGDESGER